MQIGDILVSSHGYNCTLVDFYRVIRVTKSSVWLTHLENKWASSDGYGQVGTVLPSDRETREAPIMRRLQFSQLNNQEYVMINKYSYAYPWNGKPAYYNSMD